MGVSNRKPPAKVADLVARLQRAAPKGARGPVVEQARRALGAWIATAERHKLGLKDVLRRFQSGEAASAAGMAIHDAIASQNPDGLPGMDCRAGCAFCCILSGGDGGTITEREARRVHGALAKLGDVPSGRDWHPAACPALDPETQKCRIYEDRPVVCRSIVSTDREICRQNSEGANLPGAAMLGSHPTYLAAIALSRAALEGTARVRTYALDRLAGAALAGASLDDALASSEQKPRVLDDALRGTIKSAAAVGKA